MKHCHFSILYNELPFLKQKLPFLYDNFHQLIFYDLSVFDGKFQFSKDGSHEFIKNYSDPKNKITLIELRHGIQFIQHLGGVTNIIKLKMAAYANQFIWDNIDVFWNTDMDEFFNKELMTEVEEILKNNPKINCVGTDHYLFWRDFDTVLAKSIDSPEYHWELTRIARHKKVNKYSHCDMQTRHAPEFRAQNKIYHFASVGKEKTFTKLFGYYKNTPESYKYLWDNYLDLEPNKLYGYPNMHHSIKSMGIMLYPGNIKKELSYFNFNEASKDLNI